MSFSLTPVIYENSGNTATHTVALGPVSFGQVILVFAQTDVSNNSLTISNHTFTEFARENTTLNRRRLVFFRVSDGTETEIQFNNSGLNTHLSAIVYIINGVSGEFSDIVFEQVLNNGAESPNFDPPELLAPELGDYLWVACAVSDVVDGFTSGPTDYLFHDAYNSNSSSPMSLGVAYRRLSTQSENPDAFIAGSGGSSATLTLLLPVNQSQTTPTLRKTGQQTFDKPAGIGTITGVTLNGQAITLDSQDAETFTVTDSDGSITTSGEYDLEATGDTVETITVQVNVYGVTPSNNPLQRDGVPLDDLTDVELRISAGTTLAGSELYYTGTATTDGSGDLATIDLSDTAADADDDVLLSIRTAAGDSIIAAETVELI